MTLTERDMLLSRLCGQRWPFVPLLDTVEVSIQARVLDIGGGAGGLLAELERRGHLGPRELVDVLHGSDAHALSVPAASVDVVFMVRVLAHLDDPALALTEARRVLAPGGRLIISANGPEHLAGVLPRYAGAAHPLPLTDGTPFEVFLPITLSQADQQAAAAMYGLEAHSAGEVSTCLQLTGWIMQKPEWCSEASKV